MLNQPHFKKLASRLGTLTRKGNCLLAGVTLAKDAFDNVLPLEELQKIGSGCSTLYFEKLTTTNGA